MALQFPNARLHLYSQLLENKTGCISTMFTCAYDFGLVPPGSLDHCVQTEDCNMCGAMWAALRIIEKFFDGHRNGAEPQVKVAQVWSSLQKEVEAYRAATQLQHKRSPGSLPGAAECSQMAPIVFDFLLQHLRIYS